MDKKSDFFFGQYYTKGGASLCLDKIGDLAGKVEPDFFIRQLSRFLNQLGGQLKLTDSTSHPPFWKFIGNIPPASVGNIEIYARTDIDNNVGPTLACDLLFDEGVVTVIPHWTAYKVIRADEIVSTLLVPLYLKGLHTRTYLRGEDGETDKLISGKDWCHEDVLIAVFSLSTSPSTMMDLYSDNGKWLKYFHRELEFASEVAKENLSGEDAWESLRKRLETPTGAE